MSDDRYWLFNHLSAGIGYIFDAINQVCIQPIVQGLKRYGEIRYHFRVVMRQTGYYQRCEALKIPALPAPKEQP